MQTKKPFIRFLSVILSLVLVLGVCSAFTACKPKTFTITYNLDGGTNHESNLAEFTKKDLPLTINRPTKDGYTFVGWTSELNTEKRASLIIEVGQEQNLNFVAHWELDGVPGTINYILSGGTNDESNPLTFTESEVGFTISGEPTRKGYVFTGWLMGDSAVKQKTVTINEYKYIVLTAVWSIGPEGYGDNKKLAPDFTLKNLAGNDVSLSDYRGIKPVLVTFFAHHCDNCKYQIDNVMIPILTATSGLTTDDFEILLVHSAEEKDGAGGIAKLHEVMDAKRAAGFSYDKFNILLDPDYYVFAGKGYYTTGVPANFMVDKWGYLYKSGISSDKNVNAYDHGQITTYNKLSPIVNGAIAVGEIY